MSTKDMNNLMGHILNDRQILSTEDTSRSRLKDKSSQDFIENYYRNLTANIAERKRVQDEGRITRSAPFTVDDKVYIDHTDTQGNLIRREEVGKANSATSNAIWAKLPDGSVKSFNPGEGIPAGATKFGAETSTGALTENQKFENDVKMVGLSRAAVSGLDSKGEEIDPEARAIMAATFNKHNKDSQLITVPGKKGLFSDDPPRWVQIPRDSAGILASPADTPLGTTPKGKVVTVGDVVKKSQAMGISPDEFLKQLGLAR